MNKKTVWFNISMEVDVTDDADDDVILDFMSEELVEYGFTIDDMGVVEGGFPQGTGDSQQQEQDNE